MSTAAANRVLNRFHQMSAGWGNFRAGDFCFSLIEPGFRSNCDQRRPRQAVDGFVQTSKRVPADRCPESWETAEQRDYRAGFLTGREACQWIVDTLNGPEPAAIWGLSDGDVAWWCYDALAKLPELDRQWLDKLATTSGLQTPGISVD
jgi:hypothetical protein